MRYLLEDYGRDQLIEISRWSRSEFYEKLKELQIKSFINQALRPRGNGSGNSNHHESKVVAERDLESYLNAGWEFQAQVNKGKIVVRKLKTD
jgi:hypothetical protein